MITPAGPHSLMLPIGCAAGSSASNSSGVYTASGAASGGRSGTGSRGSAGGGSAAIGSGTGGGAIIGATRMSAVARGIREVLTVGLVQVKSDHCFVRCSRVGCRLRVFGRNCRKVLIHFNIF